MHSGKSLPKRLRESRALSRAQDSALLSAVFEGNNNLCYE